VIDAAERALLEQTVRDALARAATVAGGGGAVDDVLAQLGWRELLAAEPRAALEIVFGALGSAHARATALDDVLAAALGREPRGELAVLLPPFAAWEPPGQTEGDRLHARGLATARAATARQLLVVCRTDSGLAAVDVAPTRAELSPVHGIDPEAGFQAVRVWADAAHARRLDAAAWDSAVAFGRHALACQIAGASRAMLRLACAHAVERMQFGRPIARFQAVRHRLADALIAVEALEATLAVGGERPEALTAALAKAVAGRTARSVAAHCQQVLAGMGFTTEHPFHRFLKRTMALEGIFGAADEIALDVGRQLLATRSVPALVEL
jgi:hypothetical protein